MAIRAFHILAGIVSLFLAFPAQAIELVMVEQPGCHYCELWNHEISDIYPKTEAGQHAPLRREQLRNPPDDLTYARPVLFTPTFIIIDNGKELARLEGYPGEDFFWWHIETMLIQKTGLVINRRD